VNAAARAIETVTSYLRLVEERRLDDATRYLASGITLTFPGGRTFSNLADQVASSATRFRTVRKVHERFDAVEVDGSIIVYSLGTLEGEGPDGRRFSGVRYIDRFDVRDGLIVDQRVWNDLAEMKVIGGTTH